MDDVEPPKRGIVEGETHGFPVPGSWPGGRRPQVEDHPQPPGAPTPDGEPFTTLPAAIVLSALALFALYFGTAIALTIVQTNGDVKAVLGAGFYYVIVLGAPLAVGRRCYRAGRNRSTVVARTALTCLVVHLAFLPVGLAVAAM
jgi:hypothetical protein